MNTIISKSGKEIIIRPLQLDDVVQMQQFINILSEERTFVRNQGEIFTLEEERTFVESKVNKMAQHTSISMVAFDKNILIGNSSIDLHDKTEKHIGSFSISVSNGYRGEGIGRKLMDVTIEESKNKIPELEILILTVYAKNGRACALYESFGFKQYGYLPNGIKRPDGYADRVYMYKKLTA